jgi:hypothetical protein
VFVIEEGGYGGEIIYIPLCAGKNKLHPSAIEKFEVPCHGGLFFGIIKYVT